MGGRFRPVPQPVHRQPGVEFVQHDAGLDHTRRRDGVNGDEPVTVLGEIQHHRDVAALPGQARSAAAGQHGHTLFAAHRDRRHRRRHRPGNDHADRDLPEVRRIGGVRRAGPRVEPHLPVHPIAQRRLQRRDINTGCVLGRPGGRHRKESTQHAPFCVQSTTGERFSAGMTGGRLIGVGAKRRPRSASCRVRGRARGAERRHGRWVPRPRGSVQGRRGR